MSAPERPDEVPLAAEWNAEENEWELGEEVSGKFTGEWSWWRPDGRIICRSTFDDGQLDGPFQRFHPDGTVSRTGEYRDGQPHGKLVYTASRTESGEYIPAKAPVWRVEVDYNEGEEAETRFFLEDGTACTSKGVPLTDAFDDRLFDFTPEQFLNLGFRQYLSRTKRLTDPTHEPLHSSVLADLWGFLPDDLRELQLMLHRSAFPNLFEWRSERAAVKVAADENVVEKAILLDQQADLGTALPELLAGVVCIGELGNGDSYHYAMHDTDLAPVENNPVYLWNHETAHLEPPIAKDLSSFVYLTTLCSALTEDEVVSSSSFVALYKKLEKRVSVSWQFRDLQDRALSPSDAGVFDYEPEGEHQPSRFLFHRSLWLNYLLRNDGIVTIERVPQVFAHSLNVPLTDEQHAKWLASAPKRIPTAIYVLFRTFFFQELDRLADYIRVCKESRARIIRDAALLVEELQEGRRTLGTISDVQELRRRFLAHDLDPARAQKRAQQHAAEVERREKAAEASKERIEKAIEEGSDLVEVAWSDLNDAVAHGAILDHWRAKAEMERTITIVDWIDHAGYEHDDLILEHERDEAVLCLETFGDARIEPILLGRLLRAEDGIEDNTAMLKALATPQCRTALMAELLNPESIVLDGVVEVLAALEDDAVCPAFAQLLEEAAEEDDADLMVTLCRALAMLEPDDATKEVLVELLDSSVDDEVRKEAALALGRLHHVAALPALVELLAEEEEITAALVWAIGELGVLTQEQERQVAVNLLAEIDDEELLSWMLAQRSLDRLGEAAKIEEAITRGLTERCYGKEATEEQQAWALRMLGEQQQVDLALAEPFALSDERVLRDAALGALEARAAPATLNYYYRFALDELHAEGGLKALHDALADPAGIYQYNIALRLAEIGDPSSAAVIASAVERRLARWLPIGEGADTPYDFHWMVRALCRLNQPEGIKVLESCLLSDDQARRDPVMREPPVNEALVPAMERVLAEGQPWMRSRAKEWLEQFNSAAPIE